jgi:hypothetical protein
MVHISISKMVKPWQGQMVPPRGLAATITTLLPMLVLSVLAVVAGAADSLSRRVTDTQALEDNFNIHARGWQSVGADNTIPESSIVNARRSPSSKTAANGNTVGIGFSGGGSRAYINAIGTLGGLHELNMINQIDYITGVSGVRTAYTCSILRV